MSGGLLESLHAFGDYVEFSGSAIRRFPSMLARPADLLNQAARIAADGLGLAILLGLCMGAVAWLHAGMMLKRFEASAWLPTVLMTAVVLEFGPISVGLIAASRIASGLAAEIAAMKATEQVEALQLLGVCPIRRLVAPRMLATALMLPPLAVLVDYSALAGSLGAELAAGELSWRMFVSQGVENLRLRETCLATLKTALFGLLAASVACWHGMRCVGDTAAVGRAATRSVLWATFAVLVANVFCVRLIQLLAG